MFQNNYQLSYTKTENSNVNIVLLNLAIYEIIVFSDRFGLISTYYYFESITFFALYVHDLVDRQVKKVFKR